MWPAQGRDPSDPALMPMRGSLSKIGHGTQLHVRTKQHAFSAFFCHDYCRGCAPGSLLVDKTLFDHRADAGEKHNLAYSIDMEHVRARTELLDLVLRDWNVSLVGPTHTGRADRAKLVSRLSKCYARYKTSPRCRDLDLGGPDGLR